MYLEKNERFFILNSFHHPCYNRCLYTDGIRQLRPCMAIRCEIQHIIRQGYACCVILTYNVYYAQVRIPD